MAMGFAMLAVWRRNFLVWRRLLGPSLVLNIGEPFLILVGLGFGVGHFIREVGGMSYLDFVASGIIASSAMFTASYEALWSVYTRMVPQRTYEALLATPLGVADIMLGEVLWCATKCTFTGACILLVVSLFGSVHGPGVLLALPVVFVSGVCFASMAMVVTTRARSYDFFSYYLTLFITPMFVFCSVFYPVEVLPPAAAAVAQWLPLTHAIALLRPLVVGQPLTQPLLHFAVLLVYTAASLWVALKFARRRLLV